MIFDDRRHAGMLLADKLATMHEKGELNLDSAVVIALPRGGVPVGLEVARVLHLPLDVCVVRKVGAPNQPELAVAAVSEDGELVVNEEIRSALGLSMATVESLSTRERAEVQERRIKFRGEGHEVPVKGKTVILVDDGLATGATALAAVHVLKHLQAASIVLALPVCPRSALSRFRQEVDELVVLHAPLAFGAVGEWYRDFSQVSDDTVRSQLREGKKLSAVTRER